jgi:hypothetical protein
MSWRLLWAMAIGTLAATILFVPFDKALSQTFERIEGLLAGAKTVAIVVESVGESGNRCGISDDMLKSAAIVSLKKNTGLVISDESTDYLYINVNINFEQQIDSCVGTLSITYNTRNLVRRGEKVFAVSIPVWQNGTLFRFSRVNCPEKVRAAISAYLEQFSAVWLVQNQ